MMRDGHEKDRGERIKSENIEDGEMNNDNGEIWVLDHKWRMSK